MKRVNDILDRFTSRKFLLVVAGLVGVTAVPELSQEIVILVGMFEGAEGIADIVERYAQR